jgi:predicted dehydrogenase
MDVEPFTLRWGIIGTGTIASMFISDLLKDPSTHRNEPTILHIVQAIASSTSLTKAKAFAQKHVPSGKDVPELYDSYEDLYEDEDVDIVYIATPNAMHMENALDAIAAGKHVVVEKPMGLNAKQAARVIDAAQRKGVFVMEGLSSSFPFRFHVEC